MQQKARSILGYEVPHAKRGRLPIAAGFAAGWMLGVPIGGIYATSVLGCVGMVVPMICIGTVIVGFPAFGVLWLVPRSGWVGNLVAFTVAIIASVAVSFGLLAVALSCHGC
jgi:hypothetical protein